MISWLQGGRLASATDFAALNLPAIENWLSRNLPSVAGPFSFRLIAGGFSNLTFRIDCKGGPLVLRRPPLGVLPSSAHDVAREHRLYAALAPTPVPVPPCRGLCADLSVTGAPFYVMQWVDGAVVDSPDQVEQHLQSGASRIRATGHLVEVLAAIHRLDLKAIGLDDLGPHENYLLRQLDRMQRVWKKTQTRPLPLIDLLGERLAARAPLQRYTGLVHSDYRLGNLMLGPEGDVRAVLDWELCAIGDVLIDLGFLLNSWDQPEDPAPGVWMQPAPTRAGDFPTRFQLAEQYARFSGYDVSDLDYYRAFCYWRIAIIGEGIKRRYESGAMGAGAIDLDAVARRVEARAEYADQHLQRWAGGA